MLPSVRTDDFEYFRTDTFEYCTKLEGMAKAAGLEDDIPQFLRLSSSALPSLHLLCIKNDVTLSEFKSALSSDPGSIATPESATKYLPLHIACLNSQTPLEVLEYLSSAGPKALESKDFEGRTPLHNIALQPSSTRECLEHLIAANPKSLKAKDLKDNLPLTLAANAGHCHLPFLFSCHPINETRFAPAASSFVASLSCSPPASLADFPLYLQCGWVEVVSNSTLLADLSTADCDLVAKLVNIVEDCPQSSAEAFAYAVDDTGRTAMALAVPAIRTVLQARLLFLGRYDIHPTVPVHKSLTCVVVKAYDLMAEEEYPEMFAKYATSSTEISKISKSEFRCDVDKLRIVHHGRHALQ